MKEKFNIHKDSELWDYVGQVEVTQELVDFFEEDRKRAEREAKSDKRHISYENIDWDNINTSIKNKKLTLEEEANINILLEQVYQALNCLTEVEKRRFVLNKIAGMKIVEIADLEKVNKVSVKLCIDSATKKIMDKLSDFINY